MKLKIEYNSDLTICYISSINSDYIEVSVIYHNEKYHVYPRFNTLTLYKR